MKTRLARIVIGAIAIGLASTGIAAAAPMEPVNDPWEPMDKFRVIYPEDLHSGKGPPYVGMVFQDASRILGSLIEGFVPEPGRPGVSYGVACSSPDDPPCDRATQMLVTGPLPVCSASRTSDCVDGLYSRADGGVIDAEFVEEWIDGIGFGKTFDKIPVRNGPAVPASGLAPLWNLPEVPHSGGSLYLASVIVTSSLHRSDPSSRWTRRSTELSVEVFGVEKGRVVNIFDCGNSFISWATNECLIKKRLPDAALGIRLRVSPDFGSFIFGRVQDPSITLQSNRSGVLLDVEGRPAVVPQAATAMPTKRAPDFLDPAGFMSYGLQWGTATAGQVGSLDEWRRWSHYFGPRSDALVRIWGFRSSNGSFDGAQRCLVDGQVGGWVSTNAMVFDATPPVYDPSSRSMDFKIGGPALTPTGGLASAEYDFHLRKSVADCLWPNQDLQTVASISVVDGVGGENVSTTSVDVAEDWVKFVARNVLFPPVPEVTTRASRPLGKTPTIRVTVKSKDDSRVFRSCAAMQKVHRDGVTATGAVNVVKVKGKTVKRPALGNPLVSDAIYATHARLDVDRDRLVCEREPRVR